MNDPNGMVFHDGKYHLFYQHHPYSKVWGPMFWGHAVSRDLVHWEHKPIALEPDEHGYIMSGSVVYDEANTSGLGKDGQGLLVALYTYHNMEHEREGRTDVQSQGLAYSNDGGDSWQKFPGNPVLPSITDSVDFRDPKVFWHQDTNNWVMALAAGDRTQIWGSPDLIRWQHLSEFGREVGAHGGVWECPDLVQVPIEGNNESRWVLLQSIKLGGPQGGSATQYFVGDFDGREFVIDDSFAAALDDEQALWVDVGADCYAGVCWSGVPEEDGRVIFLGWMNNWEYANVIPATTFRGAMTIPRELRLRGIGDCLRLVSKPVQELSALREVTEKVACDLQRGIPRTLVRKPTLSPLEFVCEIELGQETGIEFRLTNEHGENFRFGFDAEQGEFFTDRTESGECGFSPREFACRHTSPLGLSDRLSLQVYLDTRSVETFVNGGELVMTETVFPKGPYTELVVTATGNADLNGDVTTLKNIWE